MKHGLCFRVPNSLRRRIARIGKIQLKTTSEMAREAFREYAERRENELGLAKGGKVQE
jgi:predicted transcriptional regulator